MLGSLAASNAAKAAALCICPVGAAVVVTQVPQVRTAVHKATAPRHVPARRIAPRATPAANIPAQTAMAAPCPSVLPVLQQGGEALTFLNPTLSNVSFSQSLPPVALAQSYSSPGGGGVVSFPNGPEADVNASVLPEPGTWLQFGLGFAVLGGAIRSSVARKRLEASPDLGTS